MTWLVQLIGSSVAYASTLTPVQGTTTAAQWDSLYKFILITSAIFCVLVIGGLMVFVIKYRRKTANDKTAYISHNNMLEFLWSFIPFVLFMILFGWGWFVYHQFRSTKADAIEIHVTGKKWSWDFAYKSGKTETSQLTVPVGQPIKLIMTSVDVIHSFFIPGMRIKQDVVPGRYTTLNFIPEKEGTFQVFCTEFCGKDHWNMRAKLNVVSKEKYEEWLKEADPYDGMDLVEVGRSVYQKKQCLGCHNLTHETLVGPGFQGLFGKKREFEDGTSLVADENYIRESVLSPKAKIVKGFPPAMSPFTMKERELAGLIEFIKSLK